MDEMDARMKRQLFAAEKNVEGDSYADMRADRETRRQLAGELDSEIRVNKLKLKQIRAKNRNPLRIKNSISLKGRAVNRPIVKSQKQFTLDLRRGVR